MPAAILLASAGCGTARAEPAAGTQLTAEQAMEIYRETFQPVALLDCPKPADDEEIVVCGRPGQPDPNRPPLPIARTPGERIPGEHASVANAFACLRLCPQPLSIDIIKAAKIGRKIVRHILDPD